LLPKLLDLIFVGLQYSQVLDDEGIFSLFRGKAREYFTSKGILSLSGIKLAKRCDIL
jgi:hypothetical protein